MAMGQVIKGDLQPHHPGSFHVLAESSPVMLVDSMRISGS